jgi:TM2 domain-containing membrane protein YozV
LLKSKHFNSKRRLIMATSNKGFVPTLLLCLFLGGLGVHRFYVGKIGTGILQLVTLGGLGIWVLIDLIMIVVGKFTDSEGLLISAAEPAPAPSSIDDVSTDEISTPSAS